YAVWCTDVSIPRAVADNIADNPAAKQYYSVLGEGVTNIDRALGKGASTGTLFIARAANRVVETKDKDGMKVQNEVVVTTVCAAVASNATVPPGRHVYREVRTQEIVFATACS